MSYPIIRMVMTCLTMGFLVACSTTVTDDDADNDYQIPTKALKDNAAAATINTQLGIAYMQQGHMDRAKQKLLLALKQAPKDPVVLDGMAYFLETTGEPRQAETYYRQAIDLDPQKGASHNNYGAFLCRSERFKEAETQFLLAVRDPDYLSPAQAYENAGLCAMMVANYKTAEGFFLKALKKQPDLPNSLLELAQINFEQENYNKSRAYLTRYLTVAKPTAESLWLGIRLAKMTGDDMGAANDAQQLKTQFSYSKEYQNYLSLENVS